MDLNPYAKFLGTRDPVAVLERTHGALTKLADRVPWDHLTLLPPTGKWTAREIVAHMADCEMVFGYRLRQTLAQDVPPGHTIQPFDQDKWSKRYGNHDMETALRLFCALRDWNLLLIWETTPEDRRCPVTHPERGAMTFWTIVETMAGHDLNHLQQLEKIAVSPVPLR
jgi:hypothetical protein